MPTREMTNLTVYAVLYFAILFLGRPCPALPQLEHAVHNFCEIPRAPDNGRFEFPPNTRKFQAGSRIVLRCVDGFVPIGGNTQTCLSDGTWDGISPKCIDRRNGVRSENKSLRRKRGEDNGAKLRYGMFMFNGESKVEDITNITVNTDRGNNANSANTCIMPRIPQYGRMDYPDNIAHFSPGTKVTYSCNDGYALRGQSSRECLPTGQWDGPPPDCQVNLCKPPVTHVHGGVVIQADQVYTTDTEITHICKDGFEMKGDSKQRCLNNGLWSGEVPDCIEKKETGFGLPVIIIIVVLSIGMLSIGVLSIVVLYMKKYYACIKRQNTTPDHLKGIEMKQIENGLIGKSESDSALSRLLEPVNIREDGKDVLSLRQKVETPPVKMLPPRSAPGSSTGTGSDDETDSSSCRHVTVNAVIETSMDADKRHESRLMEDIVSDDGRNDDDYCSTDNGNNLIAQETGLA